MNSRLEDYPPTDPTPDVRKALIHYRDLRESVDRLGKAWNSTQVRCELENIRYWMEHIAKEL